MEELYQMFLSGGIMISLVSVIGWWRLFTKAGYAGWYALIPFYNIYIFCKMTVGISWILLLIFIPILNVFVLAYILYRLAIAFGKGKAFVVGLIFLYPIFILILAFGNSRYQS